MNRMYRLFSERNKKPTDEIDVYIYNDIPTPFRNQLFYIIDELINTYNKCLMSTEVNIWQTTHDFFCREKGLKEMSRESRYYRTKIEDFIDTSSDMDLLDFIDVAFHYFYYIAPKIHSQEPFGKAKESTISAIEELNERFQQHNIGYEFVDGTLVRIDNMHIHREYIKPAMNLLHTNGFDGAEEEYTKAFDALRNHDSKNAIINAEKAFESTMKTICAKRGFSFDPEKDAAKKLISILKDNGYFPGYMEDHLNIVVKALENGAPTIRNKTSGHGQGEEIVKIPKSYAEYVIGLVAVNIVFLVDLLSIG